MNHAREINDLIEEMKEIVTEKNKNVLVPQILNEGLRVWESYTTSRLQLNLSKTDFQLHLTMLKRLWNLADNFSVQEKVAFPVL